MKEEAIALTIRALPAYALLPCICRICEQYNAFAVEFRAINVILYVMAVELLVFLDHYYLLHKWKHLSHRTHHAFKTKEHITAWVAYAFHPLDGLSQGMPIIYASLIVPVPYYVVRFMIVAVGVWTLYVHVDTAALPYPFMGCDYHLIHHEKNWYNFGLFTVFWDTVWNTVKHPTPPPKKELSAREAETRRAVLRETAVESSDARKKQNASPSAIDVHQKTAPPKTNERSRLLRGSSGRAG
tara:strand:+ start:4083 stop:4805 length:723 start_codon:yes stop_codon:yes gene_type:complete